MIDGECGLLTDPCPTWTITSTKQSLSSDGPRTWHTAFRFRKPTVKTGHLMTLTIWLFNNLEKNKNKKLQSVVLSKPNAAKAGDICSNDVRFCCSDKLLFLAPQFCCFLFCHLEMTLSNVESVVYKTSSGSRRYTSDPLTLVCQQCYMPHLQSLRTGCCL